MSTSLKTQDRTGPNSLKNLTHHSCLGDLPSYNCTFNSNDTGEKLNAALAANPELPGVLIADGSHLRATLSRRRFLEIMTTPFGRELFMKRPVHTMLETCDRPERVYSEADRITQAAGLIFSGPAKRKNEPIPVWCLNNEWRLVDIQTVQLALSRILVLQNEELQRTQKNLMTAKAREEEANRQTAESITYASMIQRAFLPAEDGIREAFPDCLLHWQPRDVVGGDFYWFARFEEGDFLAVIDCTGHGVPGAFMTLIATSLLDRILNEQCCHRHPARVLEALHQGIQRALRQEKRAGLHDDGLEGGFCWISRDRTTLRYAGAGIPLVRFTATKPSPHILPPDRRGAGYRSTPHDYSYREEEIALTPGDALYLFTDGLTDVVGGSRHFTFGKNRLLCALSKCWTQPMESQKNHLFKTLDAWRKAEEIRDDITLIGLRIARGSD